MTFEEAIKEVDNALDQVNYMDTVNGLYKVVYGLQQEYAPTIEMTKEQKDELLIMKNNNEHIIDIVGDTNVAYSIDTKFNIVTSFLDKFWEPLTEEQLVQAWLHPESIKVINEEQA